LENKREEQVLPRSRGRERGQVAQIICTHVCKCKNDKIQLKKKRIPHKEMIYQFP
jgi:hypothetical protein